MVHRCTDAVMCVHNTEEYGQDAVPTLAAEESGRRQGPGLADVVSPAAILEDALPCLVRHPRQRLLSRRYPLTRLEAIPIGGVQPSSL